MVTSVSTTTPVSTPLSQSAVATMPGRGLQYGMSSFTQASIPKKSVILLGIIAVGAVLVILWKKYFASASIPKDIQEWVKQNCKDFDRKHQSQVEMIIVGVKSSRQQAPGLSLEMTLQAVFSMLLKKKGTQCGGCDKAKVAVHQYFKETDPTAPPVPSLFVRSTEDEILKFMAGRWPQLPEDEKGQIMRRVIEIEGNPAFQNDPSKRIGELRLGRSPMNNIELKAVVYLSARHKFLQSESSLKG